MDKWLKPEELQHSFSIEPLFDEFVQSVGGERVSDLLSPSPDFDNADYLFRVDDVIAELKCLQKDYVASETMQRKVFELYREWISEGSITFGAIFRPQALPEEKQRELRRLYSSHCGG